jgi:N-acetylmuramoyl-L-alanine amidase
MKKIVLLSLVLIISKVSFGQQRAFIRLNEPVDASNVVSSSRHFIVGSTCRGCELTVNSKKVKVYPTGGFAIELNLIPGDTTFLLSAYSGSGKAFLKNLYYKYTPLPPPSPDSTFSIESINTYPDGNLQLMPGDRISIRIKALPGCKATWLNGQPLYEMPVNETNNMPGIYQGTYVVQKDDPLINGNLQVTLTNNAGQHITTATPYQFYLMPDEPLVGETTGQLPYMEYSLGDDRLGGAKMGYLDTAVRLHITGKFNDEYRIALSSDLNAYVPEDEIQLLPQGTFIPSSLMTNWRVWGDSTYDYVNVHLSQRLPYSSEQLIDPSRIAVNIYGAISNTNWISQYLDVKEIKDVDYEQISKDVVRVIITLKHPQIWGYQIYYVGNDLTIQVKQQPENLSLNHLTIAIDPGHGGTNHGALGPTGVYEKELTLLIAKDVEADLKRDGARVIMTRTRDESVSMLDRDIFLQQAWPDLMISIHLNASADPVNIEGTSAYYRYIGFRPLSLAIYKRMVALGLGEFGNVGSFNFALNGPTEFPNALIETLFLSNPADEAKALDPAFRQKMANAIVEGIKDFLASCAQSK